VAAELATGKVVGWYQGRMEFGPRALGSRSILGDARNPEMQKKMNLKTKFREGFRPFAPTVLEEDVQDLFELDRPSPYMYSIHRLELHPNALAHGMVAAYLAEHVLNEPSTTIKE
jgi:carbamoyltransferase